MALSSLLMFFSVALVAIVFAADPELVSDFAGESAKTNAGFFTFTGFRNLSSAPAGTFSIKASLAEFPGLAGMGVSLAALSYQPGTVNPPHIHPRGTELLFVQEGCLSVGLIDSANKLFVQTLDKGDMFVFPRGLVHFQMNIGQHEAKALSAFSSASAGTVSLPITLFGTGIDEQVLSKAFKVKPEVVKTLKAAFAVHIN